MILTNCAACAAPLAHDAPRCVRCSTRYCTPTCRLDHWRRGHEDLCETIERGGKAEQYHADKKYKEAVAEAVEACAAALRAREAQGEAQDAFRTARAKLAQERSDLAKTLADASARP
jgi:hypothetical protein